MRQLIHPAIADLTVSAILHALGDPERVVIYAGIIAANAAQSCNAFGRLSERQIPKSTLSEHFKVLREAGLIRSERRGVEMRNTSRCAEVDARFPGLVAAIIAAHKKQVEDQDAARQPPKRAAGKRKRATG